METLEEQLLNHKRELGKNIAQSLAELEHFNTEMEEITSQDFWKAFDKNRNTLTHHSYTDFPCESMSFSIDGWDYHSYSYLINVGWEGDKDVVSYVCRIKRYTRQEMEDIISWMK